MVGLDCKAPCCILVGVTPQSTFPFEPPSRHASWPGDLPRRYLGCRFHVSMISFPNQGLFHLKFAATPASQFAYLHLCPILILDSPFPKFLQLVQGTNQPNLLCSGGRLPSHLAHRHHMQRRCAVDYLLCLLGTSARSPEPQTDSCHHSQPEDRFQPSPYSLHTLCNRHGPDRKSVV